MAQTILYYPTIDIQDGFWLRNALLYWDNISSIVPYKTYSDFSPEIQYLRHCGIYEPIFPQDLFLSQYASDFADEMITRLKKYQKMRDSFNRTGYWSTREMHRNKIYAPELYESIHYRKVPSHLLNYLSKNGFINTNYNRSDWIEIDAYAASLYMRTLAEYAVKCHTKDTVIGTDHVKHQDNFYCRTSPRKNSVCISISLNDCLPQPSMDVGYEDLLDFKQKHTQELAELRKKIREFEIILSTCSDPEEIKFQTERFRESWQLSLMQTKKMFTCERVAFTFGTLTALISAPSIAESLGNILGNISPSLKAPITSTVLLGGAAAIGVGYKFVNYRNKVNEQRSSAGFSYLLKASKNGLIRSL